MNTSKNPIVFDFHSFPVTVIQDDNGNPWFVAKDIASLLGYRDAYVATRYLDDDEKLLHQISVSGQIREITIINESGLYSLILRSNKQEAKVFKKWVTSEVLPSIRKHGAYMTDLTIDKLVANPDLVIELATTLKDEREKRQRAERNLEHKDQQLMLQNRELEQAAPKVAYYDDVLNSDDLILTNVIAKELGMSAVTLNRKLSALKVIYKQGGTWMLYSKYQSKGFARTRTYTFVGTDGVTRTKIQLMWTHVGRTFIHELIRNTEG